MWKHIVIRSGLVSIALFSLAQAGCATPKFYPSDTNVRCKPGDFKNDIKDKYGRVKEVLTHEQVDAALKVQSEALEACHQEVNVSNDHFYDGTVKVHFTVNPTGSVDQACVSQSEINNLHIENCAIDAIKKSKFPKNAGNAPFSVNYPFQFK